jgi:NADH-quinone oxidoreductase subunit J
MSPVLFWLFTLLMLGFATSVVVNRNPVASALSLVGAFLALAALFVGLDAYFIAVIQVLVYAGAVMVLFLFIIMLLDLKAEQRRRFNIVTLLGGSIVAAGFIAELTALLSKFQLGKRGFPPLPGAKPVDDVYQVGMTLFTTHNLPLQVTGVLILVATIGVIILSRRELK